MNKYPVFLKATYGLLFAILFIFALIAARDFLYPVAIAILFAYLLFPLSSKFEKVGLPRIAANFISIIFAIFLVGSLFYILIKQLTIFLADLPHIQARALENVEQISLFLEQKLNISTAKQDEWLKRGIQNLFESSGGFFSDVFSATTGTVIKLGLIPVYVFFMLYYRDKFMNFVLRLLPQRQHPQALLIIKEISYVTKRYMSGILIVVLILCFLNSFGLMIVGLKYAILLGILSAMMNFIPYFGTLIGGLIPLTFAIFTGSPQAAFGVVILFLIIQFTENNILTPNITGGQVKINPFITILGIIVGGMIWGIPGMFVAVPFLGMFKIVCDNVEELHPYGFLMGTRGTEQHHLTFESIKNRLWQLFGKKK